MACCKALTIRSLSLVQRSIPATHFFTNASWPLQKNQNQRLKVSGGASNEAAAKATSRRESVAQMRAAAVRTKWEAERQTRERLKGILPPKSSIYFTASFEAKHIPFGEAVQQLREAVAPEMYNCLENPLTVKVILNMRTKKSTKFISKLEATTILPHPLSFLPKRRIIALCTDPLEVEKCQTLGGVLAVGGADVISRLEMGGFHWDEYDDVVAHPEFTEALHRLRKILRNRMPSAKNGRLTEEVAKTVAEQQDCVILDSSSVEGVPEIAQLNLILGQLSWSDQHLSENLVSYLRTIEASKSGRVHGDAFDSVELECLPCDERILVDVTTLLLAEKEAEGVEPPLQTATV